MRNSIIKLLIGLLMTIFHFNIIAVDIIGYIIMTWGILDLKKIGFGMNMSLKSSMAMPILAVIRFFLKANLVVYTEYYIFMSIASLVYIYILLSEIYIHINTYHPEIAVDLKAMIKNYFLIGLCAAAVFMIIGIALLFNVYLIQAYKSVFFISIVLRLWSIKKVYNLRKL